MCFRPTRTIRKVMVNNNAAFPKNRDVFFKFYQLALILSNDWILQKVYYVDSLGGFDKGRWMMMVTMMGGGEKRWKCQHLFVFHALKHFEKLFMNLELWLNMIWSLSMKYLITATVYSTKMIPHWNISGGYPVDSKANDCNNVTSYASGKNREYPARSDTYSA